MSEPELPDRTVLASIFAARVSLAKKSEADALEEARKEYHRTRAWFQSPSQKVGSFRWFCEEFELDRNVILRAVEGSRSGT